MQHSRPSQTASVFSSTEPQSAPDDADTLIQQAVQRSADQCGVGPVRERAGVGRALPIAGFFQVPFTGSATSVA